MVNIADHIESRGKIKKASRTLLRALGDSSASLNWWHDKDGGFVVEVHGSGGFRPTWQRDLRRAGWRFKVDTLARTWVIIDLGPDFTNHLARLKAASRCI